MKRLIMIITLVFAVTLSAVLISNKPSQASAGEDRDRSRIRQGFAIAPVPLNLEGRNRALVGLGSYIVNAQGGCNDCHTCPSYAPGHNPFPPPLGVLGDGQVNPDNYLAGGVPFDLPPPIGRIESADLTPDKDGKPGGLTFEEFEKAIRRGIDPEDPDRVLVVMPWPVFRHMRTHDLRAIYEYLSAIPHAEPGKCFTTGQ